MSFRRSDRSSRAAARRRVVAPQPAALESRVVLSATPFGFTVEGIEFLGVTSSDLPDDPVDPPPQSGPVTLTFDVGGDGSLSLTDGTETDSAAFNADGDLATETIGGGAVTQTVTLTGDPGDTVALTGDQLGVTTFTSGNVLLGDQRGLILSLSDAATAGTLELNGLTTAEPINVELFRDGVRLVGFAASVQQELDIAAASGRDPRLTFENGTAVFDLGALLNTEGVDAADFDQVRVGGPNFAVNGFYTLGGATFVVEGVVDPPTPVTPVVATAVAADGSETAIAVATDGTTDPAVLDAGGSIGVVVGDGVSVTTSATGGTVTFADVVAGESVTVEFFLAGESLGTETFVADADGPFAVDVGGAFALFDSLTLTAADGAVTLASIDLDGFDAAVGTIGFSQEGGTTTIAVENSFTDGDDGGFDANPFREFEVDPEFADLFTVGAIDSDEPVGEEVVEFFRDRASETHSRFKRALYSWFANVIERRVVDYEDKVVFLPCGGLGVVDGDDLLTSSGAAIDGDETLAIGLGPDRVAAAATVDLGAVVGTVTAETQILVVATRDGEIVDSQLFDPADVLTFASSELFDTLLISVAPPEMGEA